ncbi:LPXTG cell wall anchor domain-containing protein [Arthrobacter bambusae]|uniref:LPXTG cell wall anchor domain-containing protein n=1 Tax=Arthrobacter bambusae TaxID=1338426 RepID=UPI0027862DB5|nr:LPXTG cell wall anchor domain-containing protein [Arthrobacter bambusae]MDQ0031433.1 LPXTG-motif cell wall-anchored protein [Arthrobacter bambusae]MDQ0099678.1 LPXTG-motif cell wall-anchored protein [Arthrobacter bambusae]
MKKALSVLALAGTIALAASAPAMAVDYPAPAPGTVSSATVTVGGTVVFSGTGFTPGETITITITFTPAPQGAAAPGTSSGIAMGVPGALPLAPTTTQTTAVANSSGGFSTDVTLTAPGTYQLTAEGAISHHTVTATVVAAGVSTAGLANTGGTGLANTGGTGLANTGVDSSLILWGVVGAGALVAGTASVVVARRRAKNEAVTAA